MVNGNLALLALLLACGILIFGCAAPQQPQQTEGQQNQQQVPPQQGQNQFPQQQMPSQGQQSNLSSAPQEIQHCIGEKIGLPAFYDLAENRRAPSSLELDAIKSCFADYQNPQKDGSYGQGGGNYSGIGGEQNSVSPEKKGCTGTGDVRFTSPPRNLADIGWIEPMGLMSQNHITPTDHGYYYPKNWKSEPQLSDLTDVLAPADGVVASVGRMPTYFSNNNPDFGDYRIVIYHTCTFYTIYIHVYTLSDKLAQAVGQLEPGKTAYPAFPVKAGETFGRGSAVDFSVHDEEKNLAGFLVPEHYEWEEWKIHTMDQFDYFDEPLRGQLLAKSLRMAQPYWGKIDYEEEGRLIGNWFVGGSNG